MNLHNVSFSNKKDVIKQFASLFLNIVTLVNNINCISGFAIFIKFSNFGNSSFFLFDILGFFAFFQNFFFCQILPFVIYILFVEKYYFCLISSDCSTIRSIQQALEEPNPVGYSHKFHWHFTWINPLQIPLVYIPTSIC